MKNCYVLRVFSAWERFFSSRKFRHSIVLRSIMYEVNRYELRSKIKKVKGNQIIY